MAPNSVLVGRRGRRTDEHGVVERVGRFGAKLEANALGEFEGLEQEMLAQFMPSREAH